MAMTLRTTDEQTAALKMQAEAEGRSMQAVALDAINEYIARRRHQTEVARAIDDVVTRHAHLLQRLGEA